MNRQTNGRSGFGSLRWSAGGHPQNCGHSISPKEAALIPNPIHKVLSIFQSCEVRALLMGGQACVFYGGAEFSRDTDFAILADAENLERLRRAMNELQAEVIAVPALSLDCLQRGHAVHFRCRHPDAAGLRVDVMSKMRGVDDFDHLWERRTLLEGDDGTVYQLMSLPDLVQAKKTQRDKDWPMIRRLIEADHAALAGKAGLPQIRFWLREARTPSLLMDLAQAHRNEAEQMANERPKVISAAMSGDESGVEAALLAEEWEHRKADKVYWEPLKRELEQMRRKS
jgi:hypothetical protein